MLPAKTVRAILRELAAVHSIAEIARRHGVSHQAVSDIKHGRTASAQRILAAGLDRALDDVDEPETARASAGRPFKLASAQDEMLYWYMQASRCRSKGSCCRTDSNRRSVLGSAEKAVYQGRAAEETGGP